MIGANGVTARYLEQKGFPALRRVLRSPERWARIVELARDAGRTSSAESRFRGARGVPRGATTGGSRALSGPVTFSGQAAGPRRIRSSTFPARQVPGHFGLAVNDYTHSTAPNRRFPDLITQRLLKAALSGTPTPYRNDELNELARHCTDQEDNATKVERQVRKSAAALLLESRVGDRFDGIVTGAPTKGTWVRIDHPAAEGRVMRELQGLRCRRPCHRRAGRHRRRARLR